MPNLIPVKLMLPKGTVNKIDELIENGDYVSRADFGSKAIFLLLASIDGTLKDVKKEAEK